VLAGTEGQELLDYHPCAVAAGAGGIFGRIAGQSGQMAPAAWRLVRVLESRFGFLASVWMFPKIGVPPPKWMVKIMENPY